MGYLSTTRTYTLKDTYQTTSWLQGVLTITVDGSGNGSFSIKMTNDWGGTGCCSGSMVCYINGTKMHDLYYDASYTPDASKAGANPSWTKGFPIQNNSSMSGTFTVTAGSFVVGFSVCRSQSAVTYSNANRLTNGVATGVGDDASAGTYNWTTTFTRTSYTEPGTGSHTFEDTWDNGFKVKANAGTGNSSNNSVTIKNRKWGYSNTGCTTAYTDNTRNAISVSGTSATRTVWATSTTDPTYGTDKVATNSFNVAQYRVPQNPTNVELDEASSLKNGRFTIKVPWKFTWDPSAPGAGSVTTTYCPVLGYYVFLYKSTDGGSTYTSIPIKDFNTDGVTTRTLSTAITINSVTEYYVNTTNTYFTINPLACGIEAGDYVKIGLRPYTRYGRTNTGNMLRNDTATTSTGRLVQNAAVTRVKTSSGWKEGVVWIKASGTWKEADVVKIKTASGWKESE